MLYLVNNENHDATVYYKKKYLPAGAAYFSVEALPDPESGADILSCVLKADAESKTVWYEYIRRSEEQAKREKEIDAAVVAKIRERYDANEELKMLRLGITDPENADFATYNAYVEECRAWGRSQKDGGAE